MIRKISRAERFLSAEAATVATTSVDSPRGGLNRRSKNAFTLPTATAMRNRGRLTPALMAQNTARGIENIASRDSECVKTFPRFAPSVSKR